MQTPIAAQKAPLVDNGSTQTYRRSGASRWYRTGCENNVGDAKIDFNHDGLRFFCYYGVIAPRVQTQRAGCKNPVNSLSPVLTCRA